MVREGHPIHEVHDEVRQAVGGGAAVQEAGDIRMVEPGKNLPFSTKAPHDRLGVHPALEDFDRDAFAEHIVIADGEVNRAHAALTELAHEAIRANARAIASFDDAGSKCVTSLDSLLTTGSQ